MSESETQQNQTPEALPAKQPAPPHRVPAEALRESIWRILGTWWGRLLALVGTVLTIAGLVTFGDFLLDQYEQTKPAFQWEASDDPPPTLIFRVQNRSRYFAMHHLILDCSGNVAWRAGSLILALGEPGNFHTATSSKESELGTEDSKTFDTCDVLMKMNGPVVWANVRVRARYTTNFLLVPVGRAHTSPTFWCKWHGGKFECREGDEISSEDYGLKGPNLCRGP